MTVQLHFDGREQSPRICACGRGCSLAHMRRDAKWASEACQKHWLREHPGQPLSAAHITDVAPTRKRSGLQVSYPKARAVLEGHWRSRGHATSNVAQARTRDPRSHAPHAAARPSILKNDHSSLFVGACSPARSPAPVRLFGPPSRRGRAAESAGANAVQSAAANAAPIPAGRVTQQPREQRRCLALLLR
jgi:hypothetical protein